MGISEGKKIAVIGLGYVGLPLAVEFAKHFPVIGFDINTRRIEELKSGLDSTNEADIQELQNLLVCCMAELGEQGLFFTNLSEEIKTSNIFIITVPTPVDRYNSPD